MRDRLAERYIAIVLRKQPLLNVAIFDLFLYHCMI